MDKPAKTVFELHCKNGHVWTVTVPPGIDDSCPVCGERWLRLRGRRDLPRPTEGQETLAATDLDYK